MGRRRGSGPPISLFSFQDIITSVTGIMVLITLMLGLELVQRTENSPPQKTAELTAQMQATVESVTAEIDALKDELRQKRQGVMDVAGVDPARLRVTLKDLEALNQQLKQELTDSERQRAAADQRKREAEAEKDRRATDKRTVAELRDELRSAEEELRKLKQSNRVIFNPAAGTSKKPWLVEVSDRGFLVAEVGKVEAPKTFPDFTAFKNWASQRSAGSEYFVLLVKPSGVEIFYAASQGLQQMHFDVGYDLLTAGQTAIDPLSGATTK